MVVPAKLFFLVLPRHVSASPSLLQTQSKLQKSLQHDAEVASQNHSSTQVLGIWRTQFSRGSAWCGSNGAVDFRVDRDSKGRFVLDWFQEEGADSLAWLNPNPSGSWSARGLAFRDIDLELVDGTPNLKVSCKLLKNRRWGGNRRWEVTSAEQQAPDSVRYGVLLFTVASVGLCSFVTLQLMRQPAGSIFNVRILERSGEVNEWSRCIDDIRFVAVLFMVLYHALQSLQRLEAFAPAGLQFFLHGLPIFVYCSGRSVCLSKAENHGFVAFVCRRALRLLVPAICGWILIVLPTQYFGQRWRPCNPQADDVRQWLWQYFNPQSQSGVNCDGLGWLGFLVMLFLLQVVLQPWVVALRTGERTPALRAIVILAAGGVLCSLLLSSYPPVRGATHPFLPMLCLLPLVCELLVVAVVVPRRWRPPDIFWASGVACRILCCIALQISFAQVRFDEFGKSAGLTHDEEGVIQEVMLLSLFYSQGVIDELRNQTKVKAVEGRSAVALCILVWGVVLPSLCLTPVPAGNLWGTSPRYPTYNGAAGAHFVMRTWVILGVSFCWWQRQSWHIPLAGTTFPFMLYVVHWLPLDVVLGLIYSKAPGDSNVPWYAALCAALCTSLVVTASVQRMLGWTFPGRPAKNDVIQR